MAKLWHYLAIRVNFIQNKKVNIMNFSEIEKLIKLVVKHGVAEVEVSEGENSIRVKNVHVYDQSAHGMVQMPMMVDASRMPTNQMNNVNSENCFETVGSEQTQPQQPVGNNANQHEVKSPMVGTVYLSSSPEANLFVTTGQQVKVGDTLCLIEAMKMFNKIEADKNGVVTKVLVTSGQAVEYGQPLFLIE